MTLLKRFFLYLTMLLFIAGIKNSFSQTLIGPNPCPADDETNRAIMEEYLTKDHWEPNRQETNTDHLTISQITVLKDSEDGVACEQFNRDFQGFLNEKRPDNTKRYAVSYYKAGDFYFVVISLQEFEDPNTIAVGVAYLTVYNKDLNRIKAYAF